MIVSSFTSLDSEGKRTPCHDHIKDTMTPQHLTEDDWHSLFRELGFLSNLQHKHDSTLKLELFYDAKIIYIYHKYNLARFSWREYSSLYIAIQKLLEMIRDVYAST